MSKARVIVLSVVHQGLTKAEAARRLGVSWQWVHTLVERYRAGGLDALDVRSSRPHRSPHALDEDIRARILSLRRELGAQGLDAGPVTIAWHLAEGGRRVPSTSSIRRVLLAADLITPAPAKRPRSSLRRFAAEQPNETWQSDFTHWQLADGTDVEILNWLDDHSRRLLSCRALDRVTGTDVIDSFVECVNHFGVPTSTLTDNGVVYTARFVKGRNGFEQLLGALGVQQKNGHPNHPQTQGKIERFPQTLKRWLAQQPPARDLVALQAQLDVFSHLYNERRPHRALGRLTPSPAYAARPVAGPREGVAAHYRVRFDVVDRFGKVTLRHAGRMRHLGVGVAHATTRVIMGHRISVG